MPCPQKGVPCPQKGVPCPQKGVPCPQKRRAVSASRLEVIMSLPERKHHRLKNYDYSSNGTYFVTICSYEKLHIFGEIKDGVMRYSQYGVIACHEIEETNRLRINKGIKITNWVVMPNHVHLMLEISHDPLFDTNPQYEAFAKPTKQSVATIVRAYKAAVTREIRRKFGHDTSGHDTSCPYVVWQKGYYDNIIKNDEMYEKVWQYISYNPVLWKEDKYNEI